MTISYSESLLTISAGVAVPNTGVWVQFVSNNTGTAYVSDSFTNAKGDFTYTTKPPGDTYTVNTGPTNNGGWTLFRSNWAVPVVQGENPSFQSETTQSNGPYAANLPGTGGGAQVALTPTPAGVTTGKLWDFGGKEWHVKAFAAKGDSVTDDTVAIKAAVTASNVNGRPVVYDSGNFIVTAYIDVQQGFVWKGAGWQLAGTVGTSITCKGGAAGAGVLRFRPGTIGVEAPNSGAEGYVEGILFAGDAATATTGHIVSLARCNNIRFRYCAFTDTRGSGLKDDQVTSVAAHGVYMYGCEQISFDLCQFANCLNAAGGGVGYENANHGHWYFGCHFLSCTFSVHFIGAGATPNGGIYFDGCFFIIARSVFFVEAAGNAFNVACFGCWEEQSTASTTQGVWIDGSGVPRLFGWTFVSCVIAGLAGTSICTANVTLDGSSWISCRFNTFSTVFTHTFTNGGSILMSPELTAVTNLFIAGAPDQNGFSYVTGVNKVPAATVNQNAVAEILKQVALVDGANVAVDLSKGNDYYLAAGGNRTINNPTNFPQGAYALLVAFTIKNNTGGAITTTWSGQYHLASAWVDPATTKQRTILFRFDGPNTGVLYEISRNAVDMTP